MKNDLRTVLNDFPSWGKSIFINKQPLSNRLQISQHYNSHIVSNPGSSRSGCEKTLLYTCKDTDAKVLIGLFGDRDINNNILRKYCFHENKEKIAFDPVIISKSACHQKKHEGGLYKLPVLKLTSYDAGAYITSGVICSKWLDKPEFTSSIHRLKIINNNQLALAFRVGGALYKNFHDHLRKHKTLPISINIGIPPVYYLLTSLSTSLHKNDRCKLRKIGEILGYPVVLTKSLTQKGAYCFAESEYVIEGEITNDYVNECEENSESMAMPEFLGYMGKGKTQLPVINITGIYHKKNPIFQAFTGPGKEQSELLAIPSEIEIKLYAPQTFNKYLTILDLHYPAYGGGKVSLVVKIKKKTDLLPLKEIHSYIISLNPLCKHIYLIDDDVDIYSSEDILWALTTRFQPSRDMHVKKLPGWEMDPSQSRGYLSDIKALNESIIFDLTAPLFLKEKFRRFFNLSGVYNDKRTNRKG